MLRTVLSERPQSDICATAKPNAIQSSVTSATCAAAAEIEQGEAQVSPPAAARRRYGRRDDPAPEHRQDHPPMLPTARRSPQRLALMTGVDQTCGSRAPATCARSGEPAGDPEIRQVQRQSSGMMPRRASTRRSSAVFQAHRRQAASRKPGARLRSCDARGGEQRHRTKGWCRAWGNDC